MTVLSNLLALVLLLSFSLPGWAIAELVDNFDSSALAPGVWQEALGDGRSIETGRLVTEVSSVGSTQRVIAQFKDDPTIMRAAVRIASSSAVTGANRGQARLEGFFYNDRHGRGSSSSYNAYEGNVLAGLSINLANGVLTAYAYMAVLDADPDNGYIAILLNQSFSASVQFDTDYVMSIEQTAGNIFDFKFDDGISEETISYTETNPMYPVYGHSLKNLGVAIYDGSSGTLRAEWDDVMLESPASPGRELVDDFSNPTINFPKWTEFDRTVVAVERSAKIDPVAENLVLEIVQAPGESFGYNYLPLPSQSLTAMQATISLNEVADSSFARIAGEYYNAGVGDVHIALALISEGSGLVVDWFIGDGSGGQTGSGRLIDQGVLSFDTPYIAKIEYDGDRGFVFTFDGVSSGPQAGPVRIGSANNPEYRLDVFSTNSELSQTLRAAFDDVFLDDNATVYDDFSSGPYIDNSKWSRPHNTDRSVENGKLKLEISGANIQAGFAGRITTDLYLAEKNPDYVEAKVAVSSESNLDPGLSGRARLAGYFYNEQRRGLLGLPYDGNDGDVWGRVQIELKDGVLRGTVYLESELSDFSTDKVLLDQDFTTSIAIDTEYLLWIGVDGRRLVFGIDDETIEYTVTTPMYPPSPDYAASGYRRLVARIQDVSGGGSGVDFNGDWRFTSTITSNSCGESIGTIETDDINIAVSGSSITATYLSGDDVGGSLAGTIDGNTASFTDVTVVDGSTETENISIAFSIDGNSASGASSFVFTDVEFSCSGTDSISGTRLSGGSSGSGSNSSGIFKVLVDDVYIRVPATGSIRDDDANFAAGGGEVDGSTSGSASFGPLLLVFLGAFIAFRGLRFRSMA